MNQRESNEILLNDILIKTNEMLDTDLAKTNIEFKSELICILIAIDEAFKKLKAVN